MSYKLRPDTRSCRNAIQVLEAHEKYVNIALCMQRLWNMF
ncbi:MAG: hypothetical protein JWQ66_309 [Mucilaginibacter sp.]|nr:hypothetical protein [Mucilaginibacter sp.]